ncbi:hypothetical protein AAFF_G00131870 [Aldrovandia affinis]|uniref:Uncharacterized protein n=1 Tax=Aldrovandia affinis TaxID=143900 RepID=A0AAD7RQU2_9TELE|nr:hypothetical protein AAFF_G00131870 [Aldrovandia affinis]
MRVIEASYVKQNSPFCRAIWMKASGLLLHFLIRPFPNSSNRQPWKSTSSAISVARVYEVSMTLWHCGNRTPPGAVFKRSLLYLGWDCPSPVRARAPPGQAPPPLDPTSHM